MPHSALSRFTTCLGLLIGGAILCIGQTYTPPPPPLSTLPPCPAANASKDAKKKAKKDCDPANVPAAPASTPKVETPAAGSAAQKFPYPGDQPATPAQAFPYPGQPAKSDSSDKPDTYTADPNVAHDPAAEKKAVSTPAGKAFPYPGDQAPAESPEPQPASSSSSSPSSSSDDAVPTNDTPAKGDASDDDDHDEKPKLTDKGSEGKRNAKTVKPQTDTERVDEDLTIARFYGQSGNAMGAYLRAKDAVKIEPDYPEAHFVLGEAAKRLNKGDEAKSEFTAYLKLAPTGERARAAEKALESLP